MTLPIPGNQARRFWSFHQTHGGHAVPLPPPRNTPACTTQHIFVTQHSATINNGPYWDWQWLSKVKAHRCNTDTHLSPLGHEEAQELATELQKQFQHTDTSLHHIISSLYIWCLETAHAVSQASNLFIKVEAGFVLGLGFSLDLDKDKEFKWDTTL
eukprot:4608983-Ditylum_brightwellii.AAC.1